LLLDPTTPSGNSLEQVGLSDHWLSNHLLEQIDDFGAERTVFRGCTPSQLVVKTIRNVSHV